MDFLINNAWAQGATQPGGGASGLIMFVILIAVFYFILIRPQMKQAKTHKKMVESLAKGDEVVTTGGVLGRIVEMGDSFLLLEVAKDVQIKIQKHAVSAVMPKGTVKTL